MFFSRFLSRQTGILALVVMACSPRPSLAEVDFSHDIVPILRAHCVECHGGKEAKGSFSINSRDLVADSGFVDLEAPHESEILALVTSTDPESQMPPKDRPRLKPQEVELLKQWLTEGMRWEPGFSFAPAAYEPPLRPRRPELPAPHAGRNHPLDRLLDADLMAREQKIPGPIDDATFLRRVSLDLIGLLPEPQALAAFVVDQAPDKRERVIDQLLSNNIDYADHWLTFFNDLLRNDYSGTGFITNGRKQISGWLYQSLAENKPFDQLTRELVAPTSDASRGYIDGIRWRGTVSAGQTVEIQFAQSVAQSFLGINLKCASCHDSFIDRWTLADAYGLAAIYASTPLELHRCDKPIGKTATATWLFPELGQIDAAKPPAERLKQLAELMTHRENGRFARTIVNRLWYQLMGRGVVHPLDAMQTEPENADLLDYLATHLVDVKYDLKQVLKFIATSQAYQSQTVASTGTDPESPGYRGPVTRRMTAEQFLDAVWQITGAAPQTMDAPVIRADLKHGETPEVELKGRWIWNSSDANAPPQTLMFRKIVTLENPPARGVAAITCDNEFTLFINGRQIAAGNDWKKVTTIPIQEWLKKGENTIVVLATNTTDSPSPAGLFFEAKLIEKDGTVVSLATDASWEWSAKLPQPREGRLGATPGPWEPAKEVAELSVWRDAIASPTKRLLATGKMDAPQMVRAGLMKNNALMRSLGRPMRDQIVSMRPTELSTLEAIDLANEATLAAAFGTGARRLGEMHWESTEQLVVYLYQFALSRAPTASEREAMVDFLGESPNDEARQDALWAICMLPEFLLIR